MLEREPGPLRLVRNHRANSVQAVVHVIHVDDRQPLFPKLFHLQAAGDAGDDAVATPAVRDRGALLVVARIDQQMPVGMLFGEVGDSADHLPAPARFRLDQHRHLTDAKLIVIVGLIMHGSGGGGRRDADERWTRSRRAAYDSGIY